MLIKINQLDTKLGLLNEIPSSFFNHLEECKIYDDNMFPDWAVEVFSATDLFKKFKKVYDSYKSIRSKRERDKIRNAYLHCDDIYALCNDPTKKIISIGEIHPSIQQEIKDLFLHLYSNSLEYWKFQEHAVDSVEKYIIRFIRSNGCLCPFCGLEGALPLDGEARPALDHWLYKGKYPMAAVNMSNLFPMGGKCNSSPAKGAKDVLYNTKGKRDVVYHPYVDHSGIKIHFEFKEFPDINNKDGKWILKFDFDSSDKKYFESWDGLMNIQTRYNSFLDRCIFPMWEGLYMDFINDTDGLTHALDVEEFRNNLVTWKASLNKKSHPGAFIYHAFIDYLILKAPEKYLYQLLHNFKSLAQASVR